jgi:hypothetical protein
MGRDLSRRAKDPGADDVADRHGDTEAEAEHREQA